MGKDPVRFSNSQMNKHQTTGPACGWGVQNLKQWSVATAIGLFAQIKIGLLKKMEVS